MSCCCARLLSPRINDSTLANTTPTHTRPPYRIHGYNTHRIASHRSPAVEVLCKQLRYNRQTRLVHSKESLHLARHPPPTALAYSSNLKRQPLTPLAATHPLRPGGLTPPVAVQPTPLSRTRSLSGKEEDQEKAQGLREPLRWGPPAGALEPLNH